MSKQNVYERYVYEQNEPLQTENKKYVLTPHGAIVKENFEDSRGYPKSGDYSYAYYQPSRTPTPKEKKAWAGVL